MFLFSTRVQLIFCAFILSARLVNSAEESSVLKEHLFTYSESFVYFLVFLHQPFIGAIKKYDCRSDYTVSIIIVFYNINFERF
jgi:hypothetical protein